MQLPKTPNKISFTPAKVVPDSFRKREDRFEFFENKGGQVFFRRKIIPGSEKKKLLSSTKKPGGGHERRLGNIASHMLPQRMPMSAKKRSSFGKSPVQRIRPHATSKIERKPLAPKNPNSTQIQTTRVFPPKFPVSATERKINIVKQPVTRQVNIIQCKLGSILSDQGLSEQKGREDRPALSGIPRPALAGSQARQSLYTKFGDKMPAPTFQPRITKLTRESVRLLPRESMAWLTQLPR